MDHLEKSASSCDRVKFLRFAIGPLSNIAGDAPLGGFFEATFAAISIFPEKFEPKNALGTHIFVACEFDFQTHFVAQKK
jgi:hypothetical protein